jgi:lipopolysaccharide export system ATP-binding protein
MILKAIDLVKKYKQRTVVNQVSVHVEQGEIVGLLGPNGAGKTTTFYICTGLVKPNAGKVYLNDEDITDLPMYKRARKGLGYLAQEASIFRKLSVEDNIKAVLEMTSQTHTEQKRKLEELLTEFDLLHKRKLMGGVLSGGERRRTEIARCLAVNPTFVLLDEPFAGVDPLAVEDIQKIIYYLKYKKLGILITDHNADAILSITDRAYVMAQGVRFAEGNPEDLVKNEAVKSNYLGNNYTLNRKFRKEDVMIKKTIEEIHQ